MVLAKWADYLISTVNYCSSYSYITRIHAYEDNGESLGREIRFNRNEIINALGVGKTFMTIYRNNQSHWNKGDKVFLSEINGECYIKTSEGNEEKDKLDYLSASSIF